MAAPSSSKLTSQELAALSAHATYLPINVGTRFFLSSFLVVSAQTIGAVALFRFVLNLVSSIVFFLAAPWCKRGGMLNCFRLGLVMSSVTFMAFASLGDVSPTLTKIALLGLLYGVGHGLYWLAYNLVRAELTRLQVRFRYLAYENILREVIAILIPLCLGALIWGSGSYLSYFVLSFTIPLLGVLLSSRLRAPQNGPPQRYDLATYSRMALRNKDVRRLYLTSVLSGASLNGTLDTLVPVVVFVTQRSELKLGLVGSLLPVTAIMASWLVRRLSARAYANLAVVSALVLFGATVLLTMHVSVWTVAIYSLLSAACMVPVALYHATLTLNILDHHPELRTHSSEHFVLEHLFMNIGRCSGMALIFFIPGTAFDSPWGRGILIIIAALGVAAAVVLRRIGQESVPRP